MTAAPEASGTGARTITVAGNGTGQLSFQLPPGVTLDIESVFAQIDATGAGATTATLTIAEQSGVVIANKAQTQTVDAGITGTATWALRLTDEAAAAVASTSVYMHAQESPASQTLNGNAAMSFTVSSSNGVGSTGTAFQIQTSGTYLATFFGVVGKAGAVAANNILSIYLEANAPLHREVAEELNYVAVPVGQTWQLSLGAAVMLELTVGMTVSFHGNSSPLNTLYSNFNLSIWKVA